MTEEKQIKKQEIKKIESNNLICIIRIAGQVKVKEDIKNTLDRLRLRKKYSCVLLKPSKDILGMINKIKYYIAFGNINSETLLELIKARGKNIENKEINSEKISKELLAGKKLKDLGLKPFFSLHPPRKGIKSKLQYPKGVLGNNKEDINKLIKKML